MNECKQEMNARLNSLSVSWEASSSFLRPSSVLTKEEVLGVTVDNGDDIFIKDHPLDEPTILSNPIDLITFEGSAQFKEQLRNLCLRFESVFSDSVKAQPAKVTPMVIEIDLAQWKVHKNRLSARPQSEARQAIIQEQIRKYELLQVIENSSASEYSQIHLVPKPTPGDWRFCLDFTRLNAVTTNLVKWPLPNILSTLRRIGSRKSKFFGTLDMTAGYHQIPLAETSKPYTSFTSHVGIYQWKRVPMGLKNAASYFQQVMATEVFHGLVNTILELYIDDCFVFGRDEQEFLTNLEAVFERCAKYNIYLNPKKCVLGAQSIDYVGHQISQNGISFSDEKRQRVWNFRCRQRENN
jgi:hypothetical protein